MIAIIQPEKVYSETLDPEATADWFHSKLPDISEEQLCLVNKGGCSAMWLSLITAFRKQQRKGRNAEVRAAAHRYQISIGIKAIARTSGIDPKSARIQCRRLAELGMIAMSEDERKFKTDPVTGRILANRAGRAIPVTITLTLKNKHMRPQKKAKKPEKLVGQISPTESLIGVRFPPPTFADRGQISPTSRESSIELNKEGPIALPDGIGRPLATGQAQPQASMPRGPRITPKPRSAAKANEYPPRRLSAYGEAPAPAVTWTDPRFEQARQRCQDEQAARDSENAKWESERLAQSCK